MRVHDHVSASAAGVSSNLGLIETIAGSAPFQGPITALKAGLGGWNGMAEDASGNLYVSTGDLGTVLKIDTSGNVTVYAGKPLPTGPATPSGDGGPATAARLVYPGGLALDAAGDLYIADLEGFTVRMVNAATGVISTVAGDGVDGSGGDGGPAVKAQLALPTSVALDGSGNLFIANITSVREVNLSTGIITTVAGGQGISSPCTLTAGQTCPATQVGIFAVPSIAVTQGVLYIVVQEFTFSQEPLTEAVVSVTLNTDEMQIAAGGGLTAGVLPGNTAVGATINPTGIAVSSSGRLDIADASGVVWQLSADGNRLTTVAGTAGEFGYSGDGGPATRARLIYPFTLLGEPNGSLLIGDSDRIRSVNAAGTINTVAGDGTENFFGDNGGGQAAGIDGPSDVATDSLGNVFIADTGDSVIRRVDHATGVITTVAGNGSVGLSPSAAGVSAGDGGQATQSPLANPLSLALDNASHLYIGSETQGIRVVNLSSGVISTLAVGVPAGASMVFDGRQTLYVAQTYSTVTAADSYQVAAVNVLTGVSTVVAGSGNGTTSGDGGPATQAGLDPYGLALDGAGNLYISDSVNCNVRVVNLSTGIIETFAGSSVANYSYSGDGGQAINAGFNTPEGLRYDGAGHLLIADAGNNALRQVALSTGILTTVLGNGSRGFSGDGGASSAATLAFPMATAFDPSGNLYIADSENDRVRRVVLHPAVLTAALSASSTSFTAGTSVTFTATFTWLTLGNLPALGTVTFYDGTTALTDPSATFTSTGNAFTVVLNNSTLAAGTHNITAQFAGDGNYAAGTSPAVTVTVVAPIPPSYSVTAAPASLSVAQGAAGTAVFTVTPAGGFTSAVTFSCGSGLPTGVICTFAPASVTPTGVAAVTTTLTVTTTAADEAAIAPLVKTDGRWWVSGGVSLACLLMVGVRRRRGAWLMVMLLALSAGVGCGSGGSASKGPTPNPNATPVGTYTLKVAAAAGSGSGAVSVPVSVTLVVTQ